MLRAVVGWVGLSAIAAVGGGCGGEPAPTDQPPAAVLLGTTDDGGNGFSPMDGDVDLIPGGQGGFHVWLKYRVAGVAGTALRERHSATRAADGRTVLVAPSRQVVLSEPGPDGTWELPKAEPAFMCPAPIGVRIDGTRIRLRVDILDANDNPITHGEAELTPHCPSGDQAEFCGRICNG